MNITQINKFIDKHNIQDSDDISTVTKVLKSANIAHCLNIDYFRDEDEAAREIMSLQNLEESTYIDNKDVINDIRIDKEVVELSTGAIIIF